MRIGELLRRDGAVGAGDLEAALRTQAQYGGRLASTLIDLGYLDLDVAARALGKQMDVPVALRRHFDAIEPRAVETLSRKAAEHYRCVPLGFSNKQARTLVVALVDPRIPQLLQELQMVVGMRVLGAVAPEIRIKAALAKIYGIGEVQSRRKFIRVDPDTVSEEAPIASVPPPRSTESSRRRAVDPSLDLILEPASGRSLPPLRAQALSSLPPRASAPPLLEMPLLEVPPHPLPPLLDLPAPPPVAERSSPLPPMLEPPPPPAAFGDAGVRDTAPSSPSAKRASTSPSLRAAPPTTPTTPIERSEPPPPRWTARPPIAEDAARRPDLRGDDDGPSRTPTDRARPAARDEAPRGASSRPAAADLVADTVAALRRASDKDSIGAALVDYLRAAFGVGVVFVTRNDVAIGWRGCAPAVSAAAIASIAVPLTQPSILATAYESGQIFRGPPPYEGDQAHRRMWTALRTPAPASALAIPLRDGDSVVNVVYAHALDGAAPSSTLLRDVTVVCAAAEQAYRRLSESPKP